MIGIPRVQQTFSVGGSDISASDGAKYHQIIFNSTLASKYRIGAPAVARGSKWWLEVRERFYPNCVTAADLGRISGLD